MLIRINERILKPHLRMRAAWFCRVYFRSHNGSSFQWFHSVLKAPKEGWGLKLWPSFEIKTITTNNPFLIRDLLKFPKEPWQWTGYLHREAFYQKHSPLRWLIKKGYLLRLGIFLCHPRTLVGGNGCNVVSWSLSWEAHHCCSKIKKEAWSEIIVEFQKATVLRLLPTVMALFSKTTTLETLLNKDSFVKGDWPQGKVRSWGP